MNYAHLSHEEIIRYIRNGVQPDDPMAVLCHLADCLEEAVEEAASNGRESAMYCDSYENALGERNLVTENLESLCDFILNEAATLKEARAHIKQNRDDYIPFDR